MAYPSVEILIENNIISYLKLHLVGTGLAFLKCIQEIPAAEVKGE
jgi:hypothetical protein